MPDIAFITDPCLWDRQPLTIGAWFGSDASTTDRCGEIVCRIGPVPKVLRVLRWAKPTGLQTITEEEFTGSIEDAKARLLHMIAEAYEAGKAVAA